MPKNNTNRSTALIIIIIKQELKQQINPQKTICSIPRVPDAVSVERPGMTLSPVDPPVCRS